VTTSPSPVVRVLTSPALRLVVLGILIVAAAVAAVRADEFSIDALRAVVADLGPAGPFVFAGVYAVAATLLLPAAPFTIAAGVVFGPVVGVATAWVGATLGAIGGFLLGRILGRGAVEQIAGRRVAGIDRFLAERGFAAVLLLRLVPLFPFNVINVVSGVTALRIQAYTLATAVGIIPGTVAYAALGGTIDDPTSPAFLAAVGLFVLVTVGAGLASRRLRERGTVPPPDAGDG
jgi:uncharacterized membrane protein YdjX (TVP38/TMEM64 family)